MPWTPPARSSCRWHPGTYQLTIEGLPFGSGVGSITFGGREFDRRTIQVERGTPTDLTVTLRATATGVRFSGRVSRVPVDVPLDTFSLLMIPEATSGASVGVAPLADDPFAGRAAGQGVPLSHHVRLVVKAGGHRDVGKLRHRSGFAQKPEPHDARHAREN